MHKRTSMSRADLLDCVQVYGRETLDAFADALGYGREVKTRDEPERQPDGRAIPTPQIDSSPIQTDEDLPPASFYRVVAQRDLTPDEVVRSEPEWHREAEPHAQAVRAPTGLRPPPQPPLMRWARLWPFLKLALSAITVTPALDIPRMVARLARAEMVTSLPRRQRRTWARESQVLLDYAEPLRPFHADMNDLHRRLRRLRGMQGLSLLLLPEGNPRGRCWAYQGQAWRPLEGYPTPPPGAPVLVVSDLGCLSPPDARRQRWRALGQQLRQSGCQPVALMPCPLPQWDREVTRWFIPVSWDRAARPPRRIVARRAQAAPAPADAAERLLGLLAPAIRVEPALLRAVRYLLPAQAADAGSEAATWNHPDVEPTVLAFSYDPATIAAYRQAFAREDPALRRQVARLIAAHHAHLSPAIGYEEQLALADLDSIPDARAAQAFIARLVKTIRSQPGEFADAAADWVDRMAQRQHPEMWRHDVLTAAWVAARQRWGEELLHAPPGIDLARVSWMLDREADASLYTLRQRGHTLRLEAVDASAADTDWAAPGSLLGHVRLSNPYPQWRRLDEEGLPVHAQVLPLDGAIPLSPQARLQLRTDEQEIVIDSIIRPEWADGISRDAAGLFVTWQEERQRAYWVNPGCYPVYDRAGRDLGQLSISRGYWRRETEALAQLREGFRQPSWAEDYGLDEYGLYAGFKIGGVYQRMRWIRPDEFIMGSPEDEAERDDYEIQHRVILSEGFWLADTACTQALWQAVMGHNPSGFQGEDLPVETVSWEDVHAFLTRLNGLSPGFDFRLPTEAEWEYACRAGTTTAFWFGDQITSEQVNYDGNYPYAGGIKGLYREETVEVKALPCNGWGLYQMHGNVREWCQDWFGAYPAETVVDPTGPTEGEDRVLRGGSWIRNGRDARSADRDAYGPGFRYGITGFRLARGQAIPDET